MARLNSYLLLALLPLLLMPAPTLTTRVFEPIQTNRCELKLVADYEFYRVIGDGSYANAARYLVNLIERVNAIFSKVDWGLDINGDLLVNLGFSIKEIKIYDKPSEIPLHFNSVNSTREDGSFSAQDVLKSFAIEEGNSSVCLSVLISGKAFDHSVLGMANIGYPGERGICASTPVDGAHMNTAVISVRRKSELLITRVVDLVVAHELGHAWGSYHDDPDDPECFHLDSNRLFIMHKSSNTGYDDSNYMFSPCSIRAIQKVLYSQAHKCFVKEKSSLCGNGILEADEQCDGGAHLAGQLSDKCCTRECKLRPPAVCSPRHSECCTSECSYQRQGVICQKESADICRQASFCTGNSSECPEPGPVEDGRKCADDGECRQGRCVSFCEVLNKEWANCLCEGGSEACLRCCRPANASGETCRPVAPHRPLSDGSICIHGQCQDGFCERRDTDDSSVWWKVWENEGAPGRKRFSDYSVFIIVLVTLPVWLVVGAWIVCRDQQRHLGVDRTDDADYLVIIPAQKRRNLGNYSYQAG